MRLARPPVERLSVDVSKGGVQHYRGRAQFAHQGRASQGAQTTRSVARTHNTPNDRGG